MKFAAGNLVAQDRQEHLVALPLRSFQLPAKLSKIDAMLRGLVLADENHRDIPSVALFKKRIVVDVDFVQRGPELA